jgi:catechol 2,3-dioxygenase-like lactoylglutathione lyase family enzyme
LSDSPSIVQIALCTADLPATYRLYSEGLGFAPSGSVMVWGPPMMAQKLDDDARASVWFLVGRQRFVQLELFTHTHPVQRPLPSDWRPSDHGWVRFGVAVPELDATLERLGRLGVGTLTDPVVYDGVRRVCFRDPHVGTIVELLEDGPGLPGGVRAAGFDLAPAIVYATISVPELEPARRFFVDGLGLDHEPGTTLHTPEQEQLWGLPGARAEGFVARGGDVYLEAVSYSNPAGRPKAADHRLSDQGFLNVALGVRDHRDLKRIVDRAVEGGAELNAPVMSVPLVPSRPDLIFAGCYLTGMQGESIEIEAVPDELEAATFFRPLAP